MELIIAAAVAACIVLWGVQYAQDAKDRAEQDRQEKIRERIDDAKDEYRVGYTWKELNEELESEKVAIFDEGPPSGVITQARRTEKTWLREIREMRERKRKAEEILQDLAPQWLLVERAKEHEKDEQKERERIKMHEEQERGCTCSWDWRRGKLLPLGTLKLSGEGELCPRHPQAGFYET